MGDSPDVAQEPVIPPVVPGVKTCYPRTRVIPFDNPHKYNHQRLHSAHGYCPPSEVRDTYKKTAAA